MKFSERIKAVGHLTIIKVENESQKEEVVYDDDNVICSGMGRTLTQMMSNICDYDPCDPDLSATPVGCDVRDYQILRFQVGTGAILGTASASSVSLSKPLTVQEYGDALISIVPTSGILYKTEDEVVGQQDFCRVREQDTVKDALVTAWVLDEETANGQLLDEAGLFVSNPYIKDVPGHFLAAYKQHTPIQKESYFSLLYRWSIRFVFENEYTPPPPPSTGGGFSPGDPNTRPGPGVPDPNDPGPPLPPDPGDPTVGEVDPPGAPSVLSGFAGDAADMGVGTGGFISLDWQPVAGDAGLQYVVSGYQVGNAPTTTTATGGSFDPYFYAFDIQAPTTDLSGFGWAYELSQRFAVRTVYYASSDPTTLLHSEWSDEIFLTPGQAPIVADPSAVKIDNQTLILPQLAGEVSGFSGTENSLSADFSWNSVYPPSIFTNYQIAWRPGLAGSPGQYFYYLDAPSGVTSFAIGPFTYDQDYHFAIRIENSLNDEIPPQYGPWSDEVTLRWDSPPPPPSWEPGGSNANTGNINPFGEVAIPPPTNLGLALIDPEDTVISITWDKNGVNTNSYPNFIGTELVVIKDPGTSEELEYRQIIEPVIGNTLFEVLEEFTPVNVEVRHVGENLQTGEFYFTNPVTGTITTGGVAPPPDPLDPAEIVSAKSYTGTTIDVEWKSYPGDISGYNLYYTSSIGTTPNIKFAGIPNPNRTFHRWASPPPALYGQDLEFAVEAVSSTGDVTPISAVSITSGVIDGDWANFVSGTFDGEADLPAGYKVPSTTFDYLIDMTDTDKWRVESDKGGMYAAADYFRYRVSLPTNHPEYIRKLDDVTIGVVLPAQTVNGLLKFQGIGSTIDNFNWPTSYPVERCYYNLSGHAPTGGRSDVNLHFIAPWCTNDINDDLATAEQKVRDNPDTQCAWTYKRTFKTTAAQAQNDILEGMSLAPAGAFNDIDVESYAYHNVKGSMHFWCFDVEIATERGITIGNQNLAGKTVYDNDFSTQFHLMKVHQDAVSPRPRSASERVGGEITLEPGTSVSIIGSNGFESKFANISIMGAYIDLPYQRDSAIKSFYNLRGDRDFRHIKFRRAGGAAIELEDASPPEPNNNNATQSAMPSSPNISGTTSLSGLRHWDADPSLSGNLCRNFDNAEAHLIVRGYQDDVVMTDCKFIETRDDDTAENYIWPPGVTSGDVLAADIKDGDFSRTYPAILWKHGSQDRIPYYDSPYPQEGFTKGQLIMRDCLFYSKKPKESIVRLDSGPNFDISGCGFFTAASGADIIEYETPFDEVNGSESETITGASLNRIEVATNGPAPRSNAVTLSAFDWRDNCAATHVTELTSTYSIAGGDIAGAPEFKLESYLVSGSPASGTISFSQFVGSVGEFEGQMPPDLEIDGDDPRPEEPPPPEGLIDAIQLLEDNASTETLKWARVNELRAKPVGGTGRDDKRSPTGQLKWSVGSYIFEPAGSFNSELDDFVIMNTGPTYTHGTGRIIFASAQTSPSINRLRSLEDSEGYGGSIISNSTGNTTSSAWAITPEPIPRTGSNIPSKPAGAYGNDHSYSVSSTSGADIYLANFYAERTENLGVQEFIQANANFRTDAGESLGQDPSNARWETALPATWWDSYVLNSAGTGVAQYGAGGAPDPNNPASRDQQRPGNNYYYQGNVYFKPVVGAVIYKNVTLDNGISWEGEFLNPHADVSGRPPIALGLYGWNGPSSEDGIPIQSLGGGQGSWQTINDTTRRWVGPNGEESVWLNTNVGRVQPRLSEFNRAGEQTRPNVNSTVWTFREAYAQKGVKWNLRAYYNSPMKLIEFHSFKTSDEHCAYFNSAEDVTVSASTFTDSYGQCFQLMNRPCQNGRSGSNNNWNYDAENTHNRYKRTVLFDDAHFIDGSRQIDTIGGGYKVGGRRGTSLTLQNIGSLAHGAETILRNCTVGNYYNRLIKNGNPNAFGAARSQGLIVMSYENDNRTPDHDPSLSGPGTGLANRFYRSSPQDRATFENCLFFGGTSDRTLLSFKGADLLHFKNCAMIWLDPNISNVPRLENSPNRASNEKFTDRFLKIDTWEPYLQTRLQSGQKVQIYGQMFTRRVIFENCRIKVLDWEQQPIPLSEIPDVYKKARIYAPISPPNFDPATGAGTVRPDTRAGEGGDFLAEWHGPPPGHPDRGDYTPGFPGALANENVSNGYYDFHYPNGYYVYDISWDASIASNGKRVGGRVTLVDSGPGPCPSKWIHEGRYDRPGLMGVRLNPEGP